MLLYPFIHSIKFIGIFLFFLFAFSTIQAQINEQNQDQVYDDQIKSVRLYRYDAEDDYPVLNLKEQGQLILAFDDLDAIAKDYSYKIIHCDAMWNPSEDIDAIDYIDGFQENRIFDVRNAFGTKVPYVHYEVRIPNEDVKLTLSGNYLIKVYPDSDEANPIITKRFMIYEPMMKVVPQLRSAAMPPYTSTHQEFTFKIQHTGIPIRNIEDEIKVVVLQNPPHTFNTNDEIVYNQIGEVIFPGLKEFRPLDIRSFKFRTLQVERLEEYRNVFQLWLFEDKIRKNVPHVFTHDLNGKFIIESHEVSNGKLEGEYAKVNFSLKSLEPKPGKIYLLGAFNDFKVNDNYLMQYNTQSRSYELNTLLKNGFYDYAYGYINPNEKKVDFEKIEGSSYETENDYLFLVYYKKFGGLYQQLVAIEKYNTRPK